MATNGIGTDNLPSSASFDDLLGNSEGTSVRVPLATLVALIQSRIGPTYKTLTSLEADLDWHQGTIAAVWSDPGKGVYTKTGASGGGAWGRIGDLPNTALATALLADKASKDELAAEAALRVAGDAARSDATVYAGPWDASTGAFPSGAGRGYVYRCAVAGTVDGHEFVRNDTIVAMVDTPSTTVLAGNWDISDLSGSLAAVTDRLLELADITAVAGNLVIGNQAPSPGAVGQVHVETENTLSLPDDNTYAGMLVRHKAILPGSDLYKMVAGTYLDALKVVAPDGADWTDAATLFISGAPPEPADQEVGTSFALYIAGGFNRIRDRLVVGNYDHSMDILTANNGTGSNYGFSVRAEGVRQPRLMRVLEPSYNGGPCDPGYPMINCTKWDLSGSWFAVRTGGEVLFGDYGATRRADATTGYDTTNYLGVQKDGIVTEIPISTAHSKNFGATATEGTAIDVSKGNAIIKLGSAASVASYTLANGFSGQVLELYGVNGSDTQIHRIAGSFVFDPEAQPATSSTSLDVKNGESVTLTFDAGLLKWIVRR